MGAAFELIDGIPNYNLYVGGKWIRSSRNEAAESRNPATGELLAKAQQAGAAETELAITAAHGAYKAWAATPVEAREAIFFRAADVLAAAVRKNSGFGRGGGPLLDGGDDGTEMDHDPERTARLSNVRRRSVLFAPSEPA